MINILDNLNLLMLNAGYAVHDGDWNWKDVYSPFTRIYYVTEGYAEIEFETALVCLRPGNLYIVPAFTRHSNICHGHFEHYYAHIYESGIPPYHLFEDYIFPYEVKATEYDLPLMKRLCDLNPSLKLPQSNPKSYDNQSTLINTIKVSKTGSLQDMVETRGIIYILASRFLKGAKAKLRSSDDRIQIALNYIRKNIGSRLSVDELARMCSLSNEHFIRVFKKTVGTTPNPYITRAKMEKAMVLLTTSQASIKEISISLGYDDNSYFNRLFKKHTGMTPMQYRGEY